MLFCKTTNIFALCQSSSGHIIILKYHKIKIKMSTIMQLNTIDIFAYQKSPTTHITSL
jgi:hypothetical protein